MDNIYNILKDVRPDWHTPSALITAIAGAVTFVSVLLSYIAPLWWWFPVAWSICAFVITIAWYLSRRAPRTGLNRIGIAIALSSDDESSDNTRSDFIASLRTHLEGSSVSTTFDVLEIPQWRAREAINVDAAERMRKSCKAHFIFFGSIRRRPINGADTPIIALRGIVTHAPLPQVQGERLKEEFTKILPHKVLLDSKNELIGTEFTSRWAGVVAKYVIALAAAMSGDLRYSEALLLDVRKALPERDSQFQIFKHIREEVPKWLTQIYIAQSKPIYNEWLLSREPSHMNDLRCLLDKIEENGCDRQPFLSLMAICAFVRDRNVRQAIAYLNEAEGVTHPVHLISLGFLQAYDGDLRRACQLYRRAQQKGITAAALIGEVETFQDWILQQEPQRYQLYFSLGFLNFHLKGDSDRALHDFREFLRRCPITKYAKERKLIEEWVPSLYLPKESAGPKIA